MTTFNDTIRRFLPATVAEAIIGSIGGGGGGGGLTSVTDGTNTVDNVTALSLSGVAVSDGGGGMVDLFVPNIQTAPAQDAPRSQYSAMMTSQGGQATLHYDDDLGCSNSYETIALSSDTPVQISNFVHTTFVQGDGSGNANDFSIDYPNSAANSGQRKVIYVDTVGGNGTTLAMNVGNIFNIDGSTINSIIFNGDGQSIVLEAQNPDNNSWRVIQADSGVCSPEIYSQAIAGIDAVTAVAGAVTGVAPNMVVTSEDVSVATSYQLTLSNPVIYASSVIQVTAYDGTSAWSVAGMTVSNGQVIIALANLGAPLTGVLLMNISVLS